MFELFSFLHSTVLVVQWCHDSKEAETFFRLLAANIVVAMGFREKDEVMDTLCCSFCLHPKISLKLNKILFSKNNSCSRKSYFTLKELHLQSI